MLVGDLFGIVSSLDELARIIILLIVAIAETYILELPVMILAFEKEYKKRYIAYIVLFVNALTNIVLNGIIIPLSELLSFNYGIFILAFEFIIVIVETVIYCKIFGAKIDKLKIWLVTLYANVVSFTMGFAISSVIDTLLYSYF